MRLLQAAAGMHTGEVCEDQPDAEWAEAAREEVEASGREVVRALSGRLASGPAPADALPWLARLIAADPYDEPTYHDLVRLLVRLGRYGEARRHHRSYALRMDEIDVPASTWSELTGTSGQGRVGRLTAG